MSFLLFDYYLVISHRAGIVFVGFLTLHEIISHIVVHPSVSCIYH